jgi:hypothetical protein
MSLEADMKTALFITISLVWYAQLSFAQTLCADGSYVDASECILTPDGNFVGSEPDVAPEDGYVDPFAAPDQEYVDPFVAPDGFSVGGEPEPIPANSNSGSVLEQAPDGSYMAPDGSYIESDW